MSARPVTGIKVVEVPYRNMKRVYYRREFDDYKLCGLYYKADVPFEVAQVSYDHEKYPLEKDAFFDSDPEVFCKALGELSHSICRETAAGLKKGECVLLTGGGCEHVVGVLGGLQQTFGTDKKIGFIWMDAHGDYNTPETSESGRPGGMPLAVAAGRGCDVWRKGAGLESAIPTEHIILTDGRNLDAAEKQAIEEGNMTVVDTAAFNDTQTWEKTVRRLADKVDMIYLHMDLDILDGKYIPNSLFVEDNGPELETVMNNIRIVMETGKVMAFSLVSVTFVNGKPGQDSRTLNGMRLLGAGLGNWKECPDLETK
ncbi:arginase family protein [Bacilliculturomica massiliensis]|uniref:arginase family protein n=1 Tax=Bacilliculturomica massiliensis TaxID=1917867 RepID=UPI0010307AA8|nr:arginase family protein [Bacilliculturomica massiliensis]